MKISKIKLLKVNVLKNGTIRLQSQLMVGKDSVDFIIEDGVLKHYGRGKEGFSFYKYTKPYEIVESINEMAEQPL